MAPQEVQVQETIEEEEMIIQDVQEGLQEAVLQGAEEATGIIE